MADQQSRVGQFNGGGDTAAGPDGDGRKGGTRVVHRDEDHDVYIGRGGGGDAHLNNTEIGDTGWLGNPYRTNAHGGDYTRNQSIALYRADVLHRLDKSRAFGVALAALKGDRLACYCRFEAESEPLCHGDVLVKVIDGLRPVDGTDGDDS